MNMYLPIFHIVRIPEREMVSFQLKMGAEAYNQHQFKQVIYLLQQFS